MVTVSPAEPARRFLGHADSLGCAGEDDGAWQKSGASADEFDQRWDIEDHVLFVPILDFLSIEDGADVELIRIGNFIRCYQYWALTGKTCQRIFRGTIGRRPS
jgi:hypothetical protein